MDIERPGRTLRRQLLRLSAVSMGGMLLPRGAEAAVAVRPWPSDRPTPGLHLDDIDGRAWTLDALKGKVVALNFWASWCEPCRLEMASLARLAKRFGGQGLVVLAVNYREPVGAVRHFLELQPLAFPVLLDVDGDAASAWTPRVFPTTVLIDRSGRARLSVLGGLDWMTSAAAALVKPLLAMSKAG